MNAAGCMLTLWLCAHVMAMHLFYFCKYHLNFTSFYQQFCQSSHNETLRGFGKIPPYQQ